MKRAMGGAGGCAAQSPTVLVARALRQAAVSISRKRPAGVAEVPRRGSQQGQTSTDVMAHAGVVLALVIG